MGNLSSICSKEVSTKTEFFEIDSWRLVGPCGISVGILLGLLLSNGQDSYATIGKGSVSDGSLIDGCAEGGFGFKISSPAGIYTSELTALFVTL
jgi:hypothetical protein